MLLKHNIVSKASFLFNNAFKFVQYNLLPGKSSEQYKKDIEEIRKSYRSQNLHVDVVLPLDGLLLNIRSDKEHVLQSGDALFLCTDDSSENSFKNKMYIDEVHILSFVPGMHFNSTAGVQMHVSQVDTKHVELIVTSSGKINKEDILITKDLSMFSFTDSDKVRISLADKLDINYLCSPLRYVQDLISIKKNINRCRFMYHMVYFAEDIDQIIDLSDCVLIAVNRMKSIYGYKKTINEIQRIRNKFFNKPIFLDLIGASKDFICLCSLLNYDGFAIEEDKIDLVLDVEDIGLVNSCIGWLSELVSKKSIQYVIANTYNKDIFNLVISRLPVNIFFSSRYPDNMDIRGLRGVIMVDVDRDHLLEKSLAMLNKENINYIYLDDDVFSINVKNYSYED